MNKATELITSEHRQVEQLFDRFRRERDRSVALEICDMLERHTEMEEEILYPELRSVDEELWEDAQQEHDEAAEMIEQIRQTDDTDRLARLMSELQESIEHHVGDEESEDLPAMEQSCGQQRMDDLGQQMLQWKEQRRGAASSNGSQERQELLDLTKDELYEKAKEADIEGRSNMNKDELADELSSQ